MGGMQDVKVSINGKLADKLGLKSSNNNLESAFGSAIQGFVDNTEYQNQALVKYNGMIFQKMETESLMGILWIILMVGRL